MADYEIGIMEEAAKKRRERLFAMKKKMRNDAKKKDQVKVKKSEIIFRSYQPVNETMKEKKIQRVEAPDITKHIQLHLKKENEPLEFDIDLYKLAPKKPDWDLRRNIEKKLIKLEMKTSRAIGEIVREKLQKSVMEKNRINIKGMPENFHNTSDSE